MDNVPLKGDVELQPEESSRWFPPLGFQAEVRWRRGLKAPESAQSALQMLALLALKDTGLDPMDEAWAESLGEGLMAMKDEVGSHFL